jgi:hypothetical protein
MAASQAFSCFSLPFVLARVQASEEAEKTFLSFGPEPSLSSESESFLSSESEWFFSIRENSYPYLGFVTFRIVLCGALHAYIIQRHHQEMHCSISRS